MTMTMAMATILMFRRSFGERLFSKLAKSST
jgi:hypothetical protein